MVVLRCTQRLLIRLKQVGDLPPVESTTRYGPRVFGRDFLTCRRPSVEIQTNNHRRSASALAGRRSGADEATRAVANDRDTMQRIRQAVRAGTIPAQLRAADVNRALRIHWPGVFLPKHRVDKPGGMTELFVQVRRGLYRLK